LNLHKSRWTLPSLSLIASSSLQTSQPYLRSREEGARSKIYPILSAGTRQARRAHPARRPRPPALPACPAGVPSGRLSTSMQYAQHAQHARTPARTQLARPAGVLSMSRSTPSTPGKPGTPGKPAPNPALPAHPDPRLGMGPNAASLVTAEGCDSGSDISHVTNPKRVTNSGIANQDRWV
jgi:hypothetical protein